MQTALVTGAGGFVGGHLVKHLKAKGYFVRGVDLKKPEFAPSEADEFLLLDLREQADCDIALATGARLDHQVLDLRDHAHRDVTPPRDGRPFDEVYHLAADMGGMGFIHSAECEIMRNSALININMIHASANASVGRYFFSSSVCVYRDMAIGEPELFESDAVPANPDNEYGWEKLYAERTAMAYGRRFGLPVRIARFQNCYGPEGTWRGGREKAPAAICRKVAEAPDGGSIEVWGDGTAVRSYTYIDDMVDGIYTLMQSDLDGPTNIGSSQYVSVDQLVETVMAVAGKTLEIRHVEGPVGVESRNFSHARIQGLGWEARVSLVEGIRGTYPWIQDQVRAATTVASARR